MEDLMELIFNSNQYLEDRILLFETLIEIKKEQKIQIESSQAKIVDLMLKIKSKSIKSKLMKQQIDGFKLLNDIDKDIEEQKEFLETLKETRKEIS